MARENLLGLVSNLTSSEINKFERKISGKGAFIAGKGFTLFISNEDCIDEVTATVKNEIKQETRRWISWSFASTFSCFISTTSNFFCSKRDKWKRS